MKLTMNDALGHNNHSETSRIEKMENMEERIENMEERIGKV